MLLSTEHLDLQPDRCQGRLSRTQPPRSRSNPAASGEITTARPRRPSLTWTAWLVAVLSWSGRVPDRDRTRLRLLLLLQPLAWPGYPSRMVEINTERLIMRGWRESDTAPWAAMNADPKVRQYLGPLLTVEPSAASPCWPRGATTRRSRVSRRAGGWLDRRGATDTPPRQRWQRCSTASTLWGCRKSSL